jgi:type I restriction enzyme M protein
VFDSQKVRYVVEVLQGISFTANRFDVIGDFFEGIVRGEFKQSKGQYLTHTNLIKLMVEGLKLGDLSVSLINDRRRLPYIIDPSCGSSAFLIESMKKITSAVIGEVPPRLRQSQSVREFVQTSFPEYRRNVWARDYIFGIEINGDLAVASKVNMVGHGDGSAGIEAKDALIPFAQFGLARLQVSKASPVYPKPVNEQYDAILSNPPFSVTVDRDTAKTFPSSFVRGESMGKSLSSSEEQEIATELLFIERYYHLFGMPPK